jgi:hypothetical protein
MKRCEPCRGTGWQATVEDRLMQGMREGTCCTHCNGIGQVPDTPDEIERAEAGRKYKMHSIVVGTPKSAAKHRAIPR